MFCGCVAYAADIILLASSLCALRQTLDICTMFADTNNILFNPAKSYCIRFCRHAIPTVLIPVQLQGGTWTDRVVHLGQVLCYNLDDTDGINTHRRAFCS